jgi:hypothetical protein
MMDLLAPMSLETEEEIDKFIRLACATFFHCCGTAKMGAADDPMAVVDARLNVRGVDGLLVADASIIPRIPTCNTHAPVTMIGERAAEFLIDDLRAARLLQHDDKQPGGSCMSGTHILASDTVLTMDAEMSVILDGAIAIEGQTIAALVRAKRCAPTRARREKHG